MDKLYEDPLQHTVTIVLTINDPIEELAGLLPDVAKEVTNQIFAELAPEWMSRYQGASWWINRIAWRGGDSPGGRYDHMFTEEPFPDPKPTNPHFGHTIQVLIEGQQWFTTDANGEPEEVDEYEVASQNILYWYCVDCDLESKERLTTGRISS